MPPNPGGMTPTTVHTLPVHREAATDDLRVASERALPQRLADDDHRCGARRVVARGEATPA